MISLRAFVSPSLAAMLFLAACSAQVAATRTGDGDSAERAEIASLEKKIAESKRALSGGGSDSPIAMSSGESGGRCDGVCQAAEEICTCHRRICRLAIDAGDEKSEAACRHAQRECEEASKLCASCH